MKIPMHPMAWGTYMLRSSFVSVIIRFRVKARENPFRFEMMYRTRENPTTVNRVQQPAAPWHGVLIIFYTFDKIGLL
jgi:hypothetical protein